LIGVQAFADALLVIIKVLAQNSGLDPQEAIVKLQEEYSGPQQAVGLDIKTGKHQFNLDIKLSLSLACLASQLLYFRKSNRMNFELLKNCIK
jgi:T-complex protein 1 subunit zeta